MSTQTTSRIEAHQAVPIRGKKILVSVPTGFQLRQFMHSGVVDQLIANGATILVASPNASGEGFTAVFEKPGISFHHLNAVLGRFGRRYFLARQHLVLNYPDTLKQKMKALRETHPSSALFAMAARAAMALFPPLRKLNLNWEGLMLTDEATDQLLREEKPDLILLGSPGYVPQDAILLHAARRHSIPVITAILSWDNLSSKGLINPQPDRLLVWSEHMRREAVELHGFDDERIFETGAVVHDSYAHAARLGSKSDNFRKHGLDPNRKLIFYGANHGGLFPDELEIIKQVAQWVENDQLGVPCQLWVRLHPQGVNGPFAVNTEAFRRLESARVHIEFPPVQKNQMLWELPQGDLEHLIRMLRDSDVVVNAASTISIDASILDRPVVCVGFDSVPGVPMHRSIRRVYSFNHMKHVVSAGGIRVSFSADELRNDIIRYLENPALDREGRRRVVEQQFGRVDGRSADRTVDAIVDMLAGASAHTKRTNK